MVNLKSKLSIRNELGEDVDSAKAQMQGGPRYMKCLLAQRNRPATLCAAGRSDFDFHFRPTCLLAGALQRRAIENGRVVGLVRFDDAIHGVGGHEQVREWRHLFAGDHLHCRVRQSQ